VNRLALGQDLLPVIQYSPVSIILPMFHTRLHCKIALITRKKKYEEWELKKKSNGFSVTGEHCIENVDPFL
jgi:hypothetical protein